MPTTIRTVETDVCVVGAGLLGLVHAHEARRRGLNVVLLERDGRPRGASILDSGHLFFSALAAGPALDAAVLARSRWIDLLRRAGAPAQEGGTLALARREDELDVIEAAALDPSRRARVLTATEAATLAALPPDGIRGALHGTQDLQIEPRTATAALARLLARDPGARLEWAAAVHEIEPGVVHTGSLRVRAEAIILCPGAEHVDLPRSLTERHGDHGLVRSRTQMLRLAAPGGRRFRHTLTGGLAFVIHPGFSRQPGADALRRRLELEKPEVIDSGINLTVTQLACGDLAVGEARTIPDVTLAPFLSEGLFRLLIDEAAELLGFRPEVRQRWSSTQLGAGPGDRRDFHVSAPLPGVRIVHDLSGRGLALAPAQAARVLDEALRRPSLAELENDDVHQFRLVDERRRVGIRGHAAAFRTRPPRTPDDAHRTPG
ncbi:MAG TPA: FAD-dependent oxidoreductase [Solirubrobacteraceae bacterium]|nr:FAD-dependent oxidoreductase [Solirubrobacteraceae bacterium]